MARRKPNKEKAAPTPQKDTLILVGNGFDIWQGLDTGYDQFEAYYHEHLDEILKKLRLKKHELYEEDGRPVVDGSGRPITFSDVELIYGDPFDPGARLSHGFWHCFEDSLDKLDTQRLNYYFGKEKNDLKDMKRSVRNAQRILQRAFCDWVGAIDPDSRDAGYRFGDNCLFINFNYTDTLQRRFFVDELDEYHIHGETEDPDSIIFGHATHPEYPFPDLLRLGGRFQGLYFIEDALYNTDKHVEDNFGDLCIFFALHGMMVGDIKNIYVLGHGFGEADIGYFRHLINATQGIVEEPDEGLSEEEKAYLDSMEPMEEFSLNVQYAMHQEYRSMGIIPDAYPPIIEGDAESERRLRLEAAVVHRRFLEEQYERDMEREKEFKKLLRRISRGCGRRWGEKAPSPGETGGQTELPHTGLTPKWHISYHSLGDKTRIEAMLKKLNCRDFTLYPSIDECITPFKL